MKKLRKSLGKQDKEHFQRTKQSKPFYRLDHIVRERYPTFTDALRDLDDALTMCFLYSTLAKASRLPHGMIMIR